MNSDLNDSQGTAPRRESTGRRVAPSPDDAASAVFDLTDMFAAAGDLNEILSRVAERVVKSMNVKSCGIRLLNDETGELSVTASYNLSDAYLNKGPVLVHENLIDAAAIGGETVYIENAWLDPRVRYPEQAKAEGLVSGLCAPMTYRGKTVGVIRVYSDRPHRFSHRQRSLLRSAGSQAAAGVLLARLIAEHRAREEYARQLNYAGEIQRRMIPASPPHHRYATFGCVYQPSLELGGDFYDFIELAGGAVALTVADVVGKGIPGALMMASVRAALRAQAPVSRNGRELLRRVNKHMVRDTLRSEFATVFYGVFSGRHRKLTYVNAGHDPPLLLRGDEFQKLETGGLVIGVDAEATYESETCKLLRGDTLVFYTDGVIDAMDFEERRFGRERLRQSILSYRDAEPATLAKQIKWDTRRFAGLAKQNDDLTVVVAKIR